MPRITELDVNGARRRIDAGAGRTLLSVLRDDLDLTGTKYGCGEGQCGACTVLIDGQPAKSCLTTVGTVAGKRIVTIEGLAPEGKLHAVQEAFLEADAMQCGWCTRPARRNPARSGGKEWSRPSSRSVRGCTSARPAVDY